MEEEGRMFLKLNAIRQWLESLTAWQTTLLFAMASVLQAAFGMSLFWLYISPNWHFSNLLEVLVPVSGAYLIVMGVITLAFAAIALFWAVFLVFVSIARQLLRMVKVI